MFEGKSPSKPDKHKIVTKLENSLEIQCNEFENRHDLNNVLVVDFMSLIRQLPMKDFSNFEQLLVASWHYVKGVCKFSEVLVVFDSYIEGSLKECERERRSTCEPLPYDSISLSTKVPS